MLSKKHTLENIIKSYIAGTAGEIDKTEIDCLSYLFSLYNDEIYITDTGEENYSDAELYTYVCEGTAILDKRGKKDV